MREQRRLAAILVADVVGYSKLVGSDEAGTLTKLQTLRSSVIEPAIAKHAGRLFKAVGDGFLVEFASAVQAVEAARAIQQANADGKLALRIGIHVGDVVVQGDDLMGDGVNIAARIESVAESGGIAISREVHAQVRDKLDLGFEDKGEIALKNLARPVHVFSIAGAKPITAMAPALALPDKPSIAVLPFQNMSGDPEQEYFTDGVTEDIITDLSRFRALFVIARNSSFTYKGKSPDIRRVGSDLGVRYVLDGSLRKTSNRIRITSHLIDALSGSQIWAERYDTEAGDVFAVQDEITKAIVGAIAPQIDAAERERAARRRPGDLSAYEIALRAWNHQLEGREKADLALIEQSIREAREALTIDPTSTRALHSLARAQGSAVFLHMAPDRQKALEEAKWAADRAVELDPTDALGYALRGIGAVLGGELHRYPDALADARRAHEMNPNNTFILRILGDLEAGAGQPERAIEHLHQVMRLSPRDPQCHVTYSALAFAFFAARQYEEGCRWASLAIRDRPNMVAAHTNLVACLVGARDIDRAKVAFETAQTLSPKFVKQRLEGRWQYARDEDRLRATAFLRIAAGLEDISSAEPIR